ncbi:MAG: 4Fe-4S binding protein, partial [Gammaproteobacteria bacterium]|nr:4Fe-4S binding protein [Gammaproteobacteria bacterium]
PFKSTWLVGLFTREWYFIGYWFFLLISSIFIFRFFCRYICPLGAALSIGSYFQYFRITRRGACTDCKICANECDSKAIKPNGEININDCFYCLECTQKYHDETVCPPLIYEQKIILKGIELDPVNPRKNPYL